MMVQRQQVQWLSCQPERRAGMSLLSSRWGECTRLLGRCPRCCRGSVRYALSSCLMLLANSLVVLSSLALSLQRLAALIEVLHLADQHHGKPASQLSQCLGSSS